jgi:hypothetical protein
LSLQSTNNEIFLFRVFDFRFCHTNLRQKSGFDLVN